MSLATCQVKMLHITLAQSLICYHYRDISLYLARGAYTQPREMNLLFATSMALSFERHDPGVITCVPLLFVSLCEAKCNRNEHNENNCLVYPLSLASLGILYIGHIYIVGIYLGFKIGKSDFPGSHIFGHILYLYIYLYLYLYH